MVKRTLRIMLVGVSFGPLTVLPTQAGTLVQDCGDINALHSTSTARVNAISACIGRLAREVEARPLLPENAIVAIHGVDGCPTGWRVFGQGVGRFMVGAGGWPNGVESGFRKDDGGRPLKLHKGNDHGGETAVVLQLRQMPPHSHKTTPPTIGEGDLAAWQAPWGHSGVRPGDFGHRFQGRSGFTPDWQQGALENNSSRYPLTDEVGGVRSGSESKAEAHNNMPPYIAVYFCKRDED